MVIADEFIAMEWNGEPVSIEYEWINANADNRPVFIFLHEGLGSLSMWKTFPREFCQALNCHGLVFSRPGYGRSTPRESVSKLGSDFLHRQALDVLPEIISYIKTEKLKSNGGEISIWLFGHSDGGSIALIYAANFAESISGAIVMAPHVMVEQKAVDSIQLAREIYIESDMRDKLGRYHDDPDSAFWGWNDVWLSKDFESWNIEAEIKSISCPLLMIQGKQDEYGTMDQLDRIQKQVTNATRVELDDCKHSPHRDQPEAVINYCQAFLAKSNQIFDSC